MDDHLSTKQVGWLLRRSANAVRQLIRDGEIEAARIPGHADGGDRSFIA